MRVRAGILACLGVVGLVVFWMVGARFGHSFPSMVDDWSAIARAPRELREVLRFGNPEEMRYRPGFIAWNALQWHALGAPENLLGPKLWGVLRVTALVLGVTLLALLLVESHLRKLRGLDPRWLLVVGVPLAVVTAPSLAVDLARYGPQEPLMVGCMSLGAVMLVRALDGLLRPVAATASTLALAIGGIVSWSFGVLQKETSLCVLLLAPFLWPTLRDQRGRWGAWDGGGASGSVSWRPESCCRSSPCSRGRSSSRWPARGSTRRLPPPRASLRGSRTSSAAPATCSIRRCR